MIECLILRRGRKVRRGGSVQFLGAFRIFLTDLKPGSWINSDRRSFGNIARKRVGQGLKVVSVDMGIMLLGYHLKSGHTLSVQNRPTGLAEDVIVLPCRSVCMQGVD